MMFLFEWVCSAFLHCVMWIDLAFVTAFALVLFCVAFVFSLTRSR